jgi:AraC-like DNA-binding protein
MESPNSQIDFSNLSDSFLSLINKPELSFQFYDMFPFPVEIFDADGTTAFLNRAFVDWNGMTDANLIVGIYNLINDPVCNDELNGREYIQRAFRGEFVFWPDFPVPIKDLVDRSVIDETPYETASTDLFFFPIWNGDKLAFVVCVFIIKQMYQGKPDVAKAKEYIDQHWLDEFKPDAVAKAVNISPAHLRALFKQHTGKTLNDYYKKVKVDHIKEKLADKRLSITEAFDACGVDSRGQIAKTFKELTGMSPTEYRNGLK